MIAKRAVRGELTNRLFRAKIDVKDDDAKRVGGIGAPYGEWTVLYEGERFVWRERYKRGCFDESIEDSEQVQQCCFNHLRHYIIASTRNKTLTLRSESEGLIFEARLDMDDPDSQRVWAKVRSGLVNGASTSFRVSDEDDSIKHEDYKKNGKWHYDDTIKRAILYEVGPVTDPAYENTSSEIRSRAQVRLKEYEDFLKELEGK